MQDQYSICTTECRKLTLLLDETLAFQWLRLTKLSPACPPETPLSQLISDCGSFPLKTPNLSSCSPHQSSTNSENAGLTSQDPAATAVSLSSLWYCGRPDNPGTTAWWVYDLHLWFSENAIRFCAFYKWRHTREQFCAFYGTLASPYTWKRELLLYECSDVLNKLYRDILKIYSKL